MPTFAYKAKNDAGAVVTGTLVAETEQAAVSSLDRQRLFPLELAARADSAAAEPDAGRGGTPASAAEAPADSARRRPVPPGELPVRATPFDFAQGRPGGRPSAPPLSRFLAFSFRFRRPVRIADTALFSRQLADLLKAGINLNRALGTLTRQTANPAFGAVVEQVRADVAAGMPLADALRKHPRAFPSLFVNMVRAGEAGGFLEDVLHRAALFAEKELELRGRVAGALIYPALLVALGGSSVLFLLTFFIPRFTLIFKDLGGELPVLTKGMIAASDFLAGYGGPLAGALLLATLLFWRWVRTPAGRLAFDRLRLRLPLLGDVLRKTAVARFTRTLGALLQSGVPILTALDIATDALGNAVLAQVAAEAAAAVKDGRSLAEPLGRSPHFPPVVVDMIAVGEESGNLDGVLAHVADAYDREVDRAVKLFVTLLEPMLLIFMAAVVGLIVIAMLLPVFSLNSLIR